jgi:hypothetical protein
MNFNEEVPEGMMEIWTVERPNGEGVLIDDLRDNEADALTEVERRGPPWSSKRLVVPYQKPNKE